MTQPIAPFDTTLDKLIATHIISKTTSGQIVAEVRCYNNGKPKVQFARRSFHPGTGQSVYAKLGRLSQNELIAFATMLPNIIEQMSGGHSTSVKETVNERYKDLMNTSEPTSTVKP